MQQQNILKAALQYIEMGWHIFPLHAIVGEEKRCTCGLPNCSDAGKHPRLQRGLKEASCDPAKINEWFGEGAALSNIGIVTGEKSGITVIDIDIGQGKFGAESWSEIIKDHGEPDTLIAQTGSGGMHVIFAYNSALKTASNVLGKGIDCRNDGGYIVASPSLHRSGGKYTWLNWGKRPATLPAHMSRRKETRGRKRNDDMYNSKYTVAQVASMLEFVPADDRDQWRHIGIILGRVFNREDNAWELYQDWANKAGGKKGRNHDEIMREAFYEVSQQPANKELGIGTIVKLAIDNGWAPKRGEVPLGNFVFYGPGNNYIYRPTSSYWIAAAVDAAVSPVNDNGKITKASEWLQLNQLVTSITCDPGIDEDYLRGHDCRNGEVIETAGAALFNTYRKPTIELGDARLAQPFIEHVNLIFNRPGDADQFIDYMAHRVQKPWEKPRFALLIAGEQGAGKDTAIEFCCPAIGVWNVANIDPSAFEQGFNEYEATTLVRISEAANTHEMSKWAFNERTKVLIAGNPDFCTVNPKYGQKFYVRRYCGVIITTNHLANGIYIPPDDRRYDVIASATKAEMGIDDPEKRRTYFTELWDWFNSGGAGHVAAFLHERNIKAFSAASGQRKTDAHQTVVASGMTSDHWLLEILDNLGEPDGVRVDWIVAKAIEAGEKESTVKGKIANVLTRAGYAWKRNPARKDDGLWKLGNKLTRVYVKPEAMASFDPIKELSKEMF